MLVTNGIAVRCKSWNHWMGITGPPGRVLVHHKLIERDKSVVRLIGNPPYLRRVTLSRL